MSLFTNPAEDTHLPYSLHGPRLPDTGGKRTLSCHTALKVLDFLTLKRRTLTWHTALNILVYMTLERILTCHTALKVLVYITLERTLTCHTALKVLVYLTLERRTLTCHTAPKVLIYLNSRGGHSPAIQPSKSSFTSSSRSFVCFHCPRIPLTPCRTCGTVSYLSSVAIQVLDSTRATSAGSVRHKKLKTNQLLLLQPSHSLKKFNTIKIWFHALALWYFSEIELQCTVAKNRTQCVASL